MSDISEGARRLPLHHITIRVPALCNVLTYYPTDRPGLWI